jgi:hypothetical protein
MRAEASAGLEKPFARAARQTRGVSLYCTAPAFSQGLGKEQRDGRHHDGQIVEEREGL